MSKRAIVAAACAWVFAVLPALAVDLKHLHKVTADGTWDCKDPVGAPTGSIVIAEKTYAFLKVDGSLDGYGTLFLIDEVPNVPAFALISGPLKDEVKSQGLKTRGPKSAPFDLSQGLFLNVVMSTDGTGALDWDCARR